jgi:hypothetical protein
MAAFVEVTDIGKNRRFERAKRKAGVFHWAVID